MISKDALSFEADLRVLTAEEGGRGLPVASGYRPNCWFGAMRGDEKSYSDCLVEFVGGEGVERDGATWAEPGARCLAVLLPVVPALVGERLVVGLEFDVCEGAIVVARGTVMSVSDPGPAHQPRD